MGNYGFIKHQDEAEKDQNVIDWLCDEFKKNEGIDLRQDKMAFLRLKGAVEKAKIELSSFQQTIIKLPFITADARGPKHMNITLTRTKLEQLVGTKRNSF
jgi:molecular chaperone DnaK